jgi:hypothetical protein
VKSTRSDTFASLGIFRFHMSIWEPTMFPVKHRKYPLWFACGDQELSVSFQGTAAPADSTNVIVIRTFSVYSERHMPQFIRPAVSSLFKRRPTFCMLCAFFCDPRREFPSMYVSRRIGILAALSFGNFAGEAAANGRQRETPRR